MMMNTVLQTITNKSIRNANSNSLNINWSDKGGGVELGFFLISNNFIEYQKSHPSIKDVYKWGQNSQSLKLQ